MYLLGQYYKSSNPKNIIDKWNKILNFKKLHIGQFKSFRDTFEFEYPANETLGQIQILYNIFCKQN